MQCRLSSDRRVTKACAKFKHRRFLSLLGDHDARAFTRSSRGMSGGQKSIASFFGEARRKPTPPRRSASRTTRRKVRARRRASRIWPRFSSNREPRSCRPRDSKHDRRASPSPVPDRFPPSSPRAGGRVPGQTENVPPAAKKPRLKRKSDIEAESRSPSRLPSPRPSARPNPGRGGARAEPRRSRGGARGGARALRALRAQARGAPSPRGGGWRRGLRRLRRGGGG